MKQVVLTMMSGWLFLLMVNGGQGQPVEPHSGLSFQEVYAVVRSNLTEVSEADLNRAAIEGFLNELGPRVNLLPANIAAPPLVATNLLGETNVFEGAYALVRITRVESGLDKPFRAALNQLQAARKLKGFIIDLRFAEGQDYREAATVADHFIANEKTLLSWGGTNVCSSAKTDAITLPLAVLVNQQTSGAAEALAGILRDHCLAVLIGTNTAGQARFYREFPLRNGQRLRVATEPVRSSRSLTLSGKGIQPDIEVQVGSDEEKLYYANAYANVSKPRLGFSSLLAGETEARGRPGATNRTLRPRNEAELVRMQREGLLLEDNVPIATGREREPAKPTIQDPALARALDLLKGLALVQRWERR